MHLSSLHTIDFKNYQELQLEFNPQVNCFTGDNGVGKTNLLDAVHYLSMCKSYFNPVDSQNIRHERPFFMIRGEFQHKDVSERIDVAVQKGQKKKVSRMKKPYDKLSEHIGRYPVVLVTPNDAELILGGSETRRRFMDVIISQYDRVYLEHLIRYNKALQQRNTLLKDMVRSGRFDVSALEPWDMQLSEHAKVIHAARKELLAQLGPVFNANYSEISGNNEQVSLSYESHLFQAGMDQLLIESMTKDRQMQYTTTGVHKDDLLFKIGDHPIKKFGSQGQQKSYLLALKLAQFFLIKEKKGIKPILLLDDIFDKIDESRVKALLRAVNDEQFGQIFITDTHPERMAEVLSGLSVSSTIFNIKRGNIIERQDIQQQVSA